jgi:hypothetical protein
LPIQQHNMKEEQVFSQCVIKTAEIAAVPVSAQPDRAELCARKSATPAASSRLSRSAGAVALQQLAADEHW